MKIYRLRNSICICSFVLGAVFAYGMILVFTDLQQFCSKGVHRQHPHSNEVRMNQENDKTLPLPPKNKANDSKDGSGSKDVEDETHNQNRAMLAEVRCCMLNGKRKYQPSFDCRKRLPHVIGIGVEKCGSGALTFFLKMHPYVAHSSPKELYYWNKHINESLDWYLNLMPVSSKYQVTMEFTPSYIFGRDIPGLIKERAPDTKFIVMLRDPVERSMSQFLHVQHFHWEGVDDYKPLKPGKPAHPFVNKTFETSVLDGDGNILEENAIVENGMYSVHLRRWFDVFPRERFLVIDEGEFSKDPIPGLRRVERFLDLPPYFNEDMIYFDNARGIYCQAWPRKKCLDKTKGRAHPAIRDDVFQKLNDFYGAHNIDLYLLLHRKFSWMYEQ